MRTLPLTLLLAISTALADQVTVTATGLPAGTTGTVTVGKANLKLGISVQLPRGTYAVQGAPIGLGGKVFVAKPVNLTVQGTTTARVNYLKLPPGSIDPLFGMGGQRKVAITGLPIHDYWNLVTSGNGLPMLTSAGTSDNNRQQLIDLTGTALGPAIPVQTQEYMTWRNPTALLPDSTGYLAGLSDVFGTVIRYDSRGKQDTTWKTSPALGPYVRGLLRWQDSNVLAYGGQTAPEVWLLDKTGKAITSFGNSGRLSLADVDAKLGGDGYVRAARLMSDGRVRLAVINGGLFSFIDLAANGVPHLVSPALKLPFSAGSMNYADNVKMLADGSAWVLTNDTSCYSVQLVHVTSQGRLDPTFKAPVAGNGSGMAGVAIQPDGKLVIAYRTPDLDSRIIRYLPNGAIDQSFGSKGVVVFNGLVYGIEVGTDGKLLVTSAGQDEALEDASAFIRITRLLTE